jgi:hydrogenase-4 component E
MENGIFLYSVSLTNGMPLIFEFGTFFDLLVGGLVMGIMTNYIHGLFESTDTENLSELKG